MIVTLVTMIIGLLVAPAPTTQPSDEMVKSGSGGSWIALKRNGSLTRPNREPRPRVRDLETIASVARETGIVGTRGQEILLVPFDAKTEPKVLLKHSTPVRFAELSPDGEFLAFSATDARGEWRVILAARGADEQFTPAKPISDQFGYGPSFSDDGRFIYFESGEAGLARFDVHRGMVEPFLPKYRGAHTVRCSPDGKYVAFSMDRAMYLYRTADESVRKLTDGTDYDRFPSFTHDRICFVRETKSGVQMAMTMFFDGELDCVLMQGDITLVCALPAKR